MSMTGEELLADLKRMLGGTYFGLSFEDLYYYLNESKKWHERNTNISFKGMVGFINTANQGTIELDSSTIDLDAGFSLIKIQDESLIYDDNWYGDDIPPISKTSFRHIQLLRNTNDTASEPFCYAVHRVARVLTLELYYAIAAANAAFATSLLRCNINQMSPVVSEATAGDEVKVPDYAYEGIARLSARDILAAFNSPRWRVQDKLRKDQLRLIKNQANIESSGGIHQRIAQ